MYKITTTEELQNAIIDLEGRKIREKALLMEQLKTTREGLEPKNLIKGIFKKASHSSGLKDSLFNNLLGIVTGFATKKLIFGGTHNPVTKLLGTLFQFTVGNVVAEKSEGIRGKAVHLFRSLFGKKKARPEAAYITPS